MYFAVNFVVYLVGINGKISHCFVSFITNIGLIMEAVRTVLLVCTNTTHPDLPYLLE